MGEIKKKKSLSLKQYALIFLLGFGYTVVFTPPFIQYVFYDALVDGLQITNTQLGFLATIYGIGDIASIFGGTFSDRWNTKTVYLIGMVGMSVMDVVLSLTMNYTGAIITWTGYAIFALMFVYPAHTKMTRLIGRDDQQGTIFGFTDSFCGIMNVIISAIALVIYAKYATDKYGARGLAAVEILYAIFGIICAIIVFFVFPTPTNEVQEKKEDEKLTAKEWWAVVSSPATWFASLAVCTTYVVYNTISYFTPYFSAALGVSVVFTGAISIVRQYGARFVGAPIGGMIADKIHSLSTVVGVALAGVGIIIVVFMILPVGTSTGILIALTLLCAIAVFMARGCYFGVPAEVGIPRKYMGCAAGLVCAIGYSPDLYMFALWGNWIDKYGVEGYTKIFIFSIVACIVGVINAILTHRYRKKHGLLFGQTPVETVAAPQAE